MSDKNFKVNIDKHSIIKKRLREMCQSVYEELTDRLYRATEVSLDKMSLEDKIKFIEKYDVLNRLYKKREDLDRSSP